MDFANKQGISEDSVANVLATLQAPSDVTNLKCTVSNYYKFKIEACQTNQGRQSKHGALILRSSATDQILNSLVKAIQMCDNIEIIDLQIIQKSQIFKRRS